MEKNIIIKSDLGFLMGCNKVGANTWSDEYPDAILFTSLKQAKDVLNKIHPRTASYINVQLIQDYGLDSERVI